MQAPPLRAALASLWTAYLRSSKSNSMVVTGAAWLLEQLRPLQSQNQACVFVECSALVFVEFRRSLLPMAHDCASNLIRFCQTFSTNGALATVASEGLIALTKDGTLFLDKLSPIVVNKVAVPLLGSKSARLRSNAASLLVNMISSAFVPGGMTRKSIKGRAEEMLESEVDEERDIAATLLAYLICYSPSTGEPYAPAKIFDNWIRIRERHLDIKSTSMILINSLRYVDWKTDLMGLIVQEHSLSFSIIPDSKKKIWKIQPEQLSLILESLPSIISETALSGIAKNLLKADRKDTLEVIKAWYLKLIEQGCLTIAETELFSLPINFVHSPLIRDLAGKAMMSVVGANGALRLRLISSMFAQIKGDWTLMCSGDKSVSIDSFKGTSNCLSALLRVLNKKDFPNGLYRSNELLDQIQSWCLGLLKCQTDDIEECGWEILGSLQHVHYNQTVISSFIKIIVERAPLPETSEETIKLDIGPVKFINNIFLISTSNDKQCRFLHSLAKDIGKFISEQWRACGRVNDITIALDLDGLCLLSKLTVRLLEYDPDVAEVAATVSSRILCNVANYHELTDYCQKIMLSHFGSCAISGMKYYLSQFNIFSKSPFVKVTIFKTALLLLDGIDIRGQSDDDQNFILDIFKEIFFPFVCNSDRDLQKMGAISLGKLVKLVGTRDFRDGMLQELIDRSLNESEEIFRRGYIIGISEVYAAVPENGSHLDIRLVIGLLSSLAKDPRSLIVQAAAIGALHRVLDARSNSFTNVLTSDITYLIWQIYMTDPNNQCVGSAIERELLNPIARTLLVLIEMLGPEISNPGTVPRICRLLVSEFLEYDVCDDPQLVGLFFDSVVQMLIVSQTFDNLPSLLALIHEVIRRKNPLNLEKAINCLRWFLEFHPQTVVRLGEFSLIYSLLALLPKPSRNLDYCLQSLFDLSFVSDPDQWISMSLNAKVFKSKTRSVNTVSITASQHESALLGEEPRNMTSTSLVDNVMMISREALHKTIELMMQFLADQGERLDQIWEIKTLNTFIDNITRLSMNMLMIPIQTWETQSLKLLGIGLIKVLIACCGQVKDPADTRYYLLDFFQSQLITIFSTASQDDDILVATHSYVALFDLVSGCLKEELQFKRHPKVTSLVAKAFNVLAQGEFITEVLGLYCKTLIVTSFLDMKDRLSEDQRAQLELQGNDYMLRCIDNLLDRNDLDQSIIDLSSKLIIESDNEEYTYLGSCLLLLQANVTPFYVQAVSKLSKPIPKNILNALLDRICRGMTLDVAMAVISHLSTFEETVDHRHLQVLIRKSASLFLKTEVLDSAAIGQAIRLSSCLCSLESYNTIEATKFANIIIHGKFTIDQHADIAAIIFSDSNPVHALKVMWTLLRSDLKLPAMFVDQATIMLRQLFVVDPVSAFEFWTKFLKHPKIQSISINSADLLARSHQAGISMEVDFALVPTGTIRDCLTVLLQ